MQKTHTHTDTTVERAHHTAVIPICMDWCYTTYIQGVKLHQPKKKDAQQIVHTVKFQQQQKKKKGNLTTRQGRPTFD